MATYSLSLRKWILSLISLNQYWFCDLSRPTKCGSDVLGPPSQGHRRLVASTSLYGKPATNYKGTQDSLLNGERNMEGEKGHVAEH